MYKIDGDPAAIMRSGNSGSFRVRFEEREASPAVTGNEAGGIQQGDHDAAVDPLEPVGPVAHGAGTLKASEDKEEAVVEIQSHTPGGYRVQYTDAAHEQMESLDSELCSRVDGAVQGVASVSPRNRSSQVEGMLDRRRVKAEGILVTFWLSEPVGMERILTVVDVAHEAETLEVKVGRKSTHVIPLRETPLSYVTFIESPEEAGRLLHPVAS